MIFSWILIKCILTVEIVITVRGSLVTTTEPSSLDCLESLDDDEEPVDCDYEGWQLSPNCSESHPIEIYKDKYAKYKATFYQLGCCQEYSNEQSITRWQNMAKNCRATDCQQDSGQDFCSTLNPRYINETKLIYEEIARDPCSTSTTGSGFVALCCRQNSVEEVLATILGAEAHEFPHHVLVETKASQCGGTIYNRRFVITAAHCVVQLENGRPFLANDTSIVVGTNIQGLGDNADEYVYQAKNLIINDNYSLLASNPNHELCPPDGSTSRFVHDIALVEVDRDFEFSDTVKPLQLTPRKFNPLKYSDHAVVVGWGTTETLQSPKYLQKTNFVLREDSACFSSGIEEYNPYKEHEDKLLCIGGIRDGLVSFSAGRGDSGGPAICRNAYGNPVLCGITSFGGDDEYCEYFHDVENCLPSVYVDASYYRTWIEKHAGKQDRNDLFTYQLYGEEIAKNEFPHQVHISSKNASLCGGTLIEPDVILTAAHCIFDLENSGSQLLNNLEVFSEQNVYLVKTARRLNSTKRDERPEPDLNSNDKAIYGESRYQADLAVVLLRKSFPISQTQLPKLSSRNLSDEIETAMELAFPRLLTKSGRLVRRKFKILKEGECRKRLRTISKSQIDLELGEGELCGVEEYSGGSVCDRTVGGGLFGESKTGSHVLVGIQAYRTCMLSVPSIFVSVGNYFQWIRSSIEEMRNI